jgi:hypothetical protein
MQLFNKVFTTFTPVITVLLGICLVIKSDNDGKWNPFDWFGFMVFNATSNNISGISWRSVLFVEDPDKTTDLSQVTDKLYHIMLYTSPWSRFDFITSVVIGTDYTGSNKFNKSNTFNYHPTTATKSIWNILKLVARYCEEGVYDKFYKSILRH